MSETPVKSRRHVSDMIYDVAARAATSKVVEDHLDNLPALSLYAFVTSVMILGSRILALGRIELGLAEILNWTRPSMTLCVLIAYTQLCYYPQWIILLPLFYFVTMILIPNYAMKFKISSDDFEEDLRVSSKGYDSSSSILMPDVERPVLADPISESEKKKHERSLVNAIRKGQKQLTDIVNLLDKLDRFSDGPVKFTNPQTSIVMLVFCTLLLLVSGYILTVIPISSICSATAWIFVLCRHPLVLKWRKKLEIKLPATDISYEKAKEQLTEFSKNVILVDDEKLKRQVQIFELQPQGLTARQWKTDSAVFSPSIYMNDSSERLQRMKPIGAKDLKEVLPPKSWHFDQTEDWEIDNDANGWLSQLKSNELQVDGCWAYDVNVDLESIRWRRRRLTRNCYYDFK